MCLKREHPFLVPLFSINKYVKCILHPAISLWLLIHILHLHTSYHLHAFQMSKLVYQTKLYRNFNEQPCTVIQNFLESRGAKIKNRTKTKQKGPPSKKEMLFLGWQEKQNNNNNKKIFTSKSGLWSHPPTTFRWGLEMKMTLIHINLAVKA